MSVAFRTLTTALSLASLATFGATAHAKPYKVFLSMSYIGNDWQAEAANMVKAMAASKGPDKLTLETQVSGPNPQRQIQQINAMVQAGANAIVVYPISPTRSIRPSERLRPGRRRRTPTTRSSPGPAPTTRPSIRTPRAASLPSGS